MNSPFNNAPPPVTANSTLTNNKARGPRKRKKNQDNSNPNGSKKSKLEVSNKQHKSHGFPAEHPFNKDGYRYLLAEPDPCIPDNEPDTDNTAKPIPSKQYRRWLPDKVLLTLHDRAQILKISDDRLSVTGEKGYSMVRASHSVKHGSWYFEATITDMPQDSATRIGWSQKLGNLQAPLGYDKFGYSWRSKKGTRFHQSKGKHYSDGYTVGDKLGFYIHYPKGEQKCHLAEDTCKDSALIKFKTFFYFEEKDDVEAAEKQLTPAAGSYLEFFKNGVSQGKVYQDELFHGEYYPCVSIYKNATVRLNFGPDFECPPPADVKYQPVSDREFESVIEASLNDLLYAAVLEADGEKKNTVSETLKGISQQDK